MKKSGGDLLREACRKGKLNRLLEQYILFCKEEAEEETRSREAARGRRRRAGAFPNLAGFCRAKRIGIGELAQLEREFPEQFEQFYVILEDEALNSGLPPPILSAYLKKRLGYERESGSHGEGTVEVRFEHDVFKDGE